MSTDDKSETAQTPPGLKGFLLLMLVLLLLLFFFGAAWSVGRPWGRMGFIIDGSAFASFFVAVFTAYV